MKQVVVILLVLIFVKPVVAQNEDLIREVERHILWVDSLIVCCWDSIASNHTQFIARGRGRRSTVAEWSSFYNASSDAFDTSLIWRERGERCFEEVMKEIDEVQNKQNGQEF